MSMSIHDVPVEPRPRAEILAGIKNVVQFLEDHPEFDLPEKLQELYVRTLARRNRNELTGKAEATAWFVRHLEMLQPDELFNGEYLGAIKDFGGGVVLKLYVNVNEVCERTLEGVPVVVAGVKDVPTWHCPQQLTDLGFTIDQDELRRAYDRTTPYR